MNNKNCEKKEKFNLKEKKENVICSLFEIENFLCNIKKICNGIKLYKILKYQLSANSLACNSGAEVNTAKYLKK